MNLDPAELPRQLIPMLRLRSPEIKARPADYARRLVEECRASLGAVLPLTDAERSFLGLLLDRGVIDPTILTSDPNLQQRIRSQPLLEWKSLHVKHHKKLP